MSYEALSHLATARLSHSLGNRAEAEAGYRAALAIAPDLVSAHFHLAMVLVETRQSKAALACLDQLFTLAPNDAAAWHLRGSAFRNTSQPNEAVAAYERAIVLRPDFAAAHRDLGQLLNRLSRVDDALVYLQRAVALSPDDAAAHIELGRTFETLHRDDEAEAQFRRAQEIKPLTTIPAAGTTPAFSALFLWSGGRANTPMHNLLENAPFDSLLLMLVRSTVVGANVLANAAKTCDVIVNLVCDADQGHDILPQAADIADGIDKSIVNHPRHIAATARDAIAARLSGIPSLRIASIARHDTASLMAWAKAAPTRLERPQLLRIAGTHGGDAFEYVQTSADIELFARNHSAATYYLIDYIDYRSADGFFRKYRVVFVDGQMYPYHLAIGAQWKVHHFRTDMAQHAWMQDEERTFIGDIAAVFGPPQIASLRAINELLHLDFFGVDCALDHDGNLVVFEANAAMLVQPDDSGFEYKLARNESIKAAFAAMLASKR